MGYNISWFNETFSWQGLFSNVIDMTGNALPLGLLLITFLLLLFMWKNFDTKATMVMASFGTTLVAMIMSFAGWLDLAFITAPILVFVGSVFYYMFGSD